jgi:hypothetical protein
MYHTGLGMGVFKWYNLSSPPQTPLQCLHSGFHLDPELASRDEGAPREGKTCGAAGGIVPIATTSHKPSSESKNIGLYKSASRQFF